MPTFLTVPKLAVAAFVFGWAGPALACPDYRQNGSQASYTSDQLYTAVRNTVTAGGDIDLARCSAMPGSGWVTRQPDFTFRLSGNAAARRLLRFRVDAGCDTVLLVNGPSAGWRFDDDGGEGLNPQLDFDAAPDGIYDIWVGTSSRGDCSAALISETFDQQRPQGKRSR